MKISRKPAPEPKFTHQFESLRIKVVTSVFFFKSTFFVSFQCIYHRMLNNWQKKKNIMKMSRSPVPYPNFTH